MIASGLRPGAASAFLASYLDLVDPLGQDLPERRALALAHLDEIGERLVEGLRGGGTRGLVLLLVTLGLGDLDDALDGEQAVDARRDRVDLAGDHRGRLEDGVEHVLVDADGGCGVGALDVEIGVDGAARQKLAGALLGVGLELVEPLRQPHPEVKALGVDRLQFPFERIRPASAVASGKAGHGRQRHQVNFSGNTGFARPIRPRES